MDENTLYHQPLTYALLLKLSKKKQIEIGKLGSISFAPGYYAYVGSAKKNGYARLNRHWSKEKRMKWHIDYLRQEAMPVALFVFEQEKIGECSLAEALAEHFVYIKKFGSSDCTCPSHLYYSVKSGPVREKLYEQKGLIKTVRPKYNRKGE